MKIAIIMLLSISTLLDGCYDSSHNLRFSRDPAVLAKIALDHQEPEHYRLKATESINNSEVLARIARFDPSPRVRLKATRTSLRQADLKTIALNDTEKEVRFRATRFLSDNFALYDVATTDPETQNQEAAAERITNPLLLEQIMLGIHSASVRTAALSQVTDQLLISRVIEKDSDVAVRIAAIKKSEDATLLRQIALTPYSWGVDERLAATGNITSDRVLTEIANHNKIGEKYTERAIRGLAVSNIQSSEYLSQIDYGPMHFRRHPIDWPISIRDLCRLIRHPKTQGYHPDLAVNLNWKSIAHGYVDSGGGKLSVKGEQVGITIQFENFDPIKDTWSTKFPAYTQNPLYIGAEGDLAEIVRLVVQRTDYQDSEIETLLEELPRLGTEIVSGVSSNNLLNRLAQEAESVWVQDAALKAMTNQDDLVRWAFDDSHTIQQRAIATRGISDDSRLQQLFTGEQNSMLRLAAVKSMRDQSYLKAIAESGESVEIRLAAIANISDIEFLQAFSSRATEVKIKHRASNQASLCRHRDKRCPK